MSKLLDYQALLFDVDKTLTNLQQQISPATKQALHKLNQLPQLKISICTGKNVTSVKNTILPLFPQNSLHITAGGSQIIDSQGKLKWGIAIDQQALSKLLNKINLKNNDQRHIVFSKLDAKYTTQASINRHQANKDTQTVKLINQMAPQGVYLVYIKQPTPKVISFIKSNNKLSYKIMTTYDNQPYIDVTAKGVNKYTALQQWSKINNIALNKIIGFGDSLNDLEFLQHVGFSVAMGNATNQVKQIADRIIDHTNNDGLANYLLKIITGENL